MRTVWSTTFSALAALCLLRGASCGEFYEDEHGVLLLDQSNFNEAIAQHELLLVKFFAPWCGHCKKFAPVYNDIAGQMRKEAPAVRLGKLDATAAVSVAERFEVQGFPKLKLFRNGRPENYDGKRTTDDVVAFLRDRNRAACKQIHSVEEATKFAGHSDAAVIGFFDKLEGPEWETFQRAGKVHDEVRFAVTTDAATIAHYAVTLPTAVLFKAQSLQDEGQEKLQGAAIGDPARLNRFVVGNSMPSVIDFANQEQRKFLGPGRVRFFGVQLMYFVDDAAPDAGQHRENMKAIAHKNKERIMHVLIGPTHKKVIKFFGLATSDFPAVAILRVNEQDPEKSVKYDFSVSITRRFDVAGLLAFTDDYFAGRLRPRLKSQEPPSNQDGELVKTIVGKTFESGVMGGKDIGKDLLLEFYSPKCEYCKELQPHYERLAKELSEAKVHSIVVAKMDATANEVLHDKIEVSSFPTVFLFPAKDRENPLKFEGSRDFDALFHFLSENAAVPFTFGGEGHGAGVRDQPQDDVM